MSALLLSNDQVFPLLFTMVEPGVYIERRTWSCCGRSGSFGISSGCQVSRHEKVDLQEPQMVPESHEVQNLQYILLDPKCAEYLVVFRRL